jgi:hypothetical protein
MTDLFRALDGRGIADLVLVNTASRPRADELSSAAGRRPAVRLSRAKSAAKPIGTVC